MVDASRRQAYDSAVYDLVIDAGSIRHERGAFGADSLLGTSSDTISSAMFPAKVES